MMLLMAMCVIAGCTMMSRADDKDKDKEEGNEQKMAFNQAPQSVQQTLTKEADGNKIDQVDKETDDGKTIYEADVTINGKNYEIKVAEDGTLISKKLDMEDEKDEHKEGKNGKHEGKDDDDKNEKSEKHEEKK
jgi:hypothetical protein